MLRFSKKVNEKHTSMLVGLMRGVWPAGADPPLCLEGPRDVPAKHSSSNTSWGLIVFFGKILSCSLSCSGYVLGDGCW